MAAGQRIIEALQDEVVGNFARVTVEGATWISKEELDRLRAELERRLKALDVMKGDCAEAFAENERLRDLVRVLVDNDPSDMAADAVTVLDVWREGASAVLGRTAVRDPEAPPDGSLSKSTMRRRAATATEGK